MIASSYYGMMQFPFLQRNEEKFCIVNAVVGDVESSYG